MLIDTDKSLYKKYLSIYTSNLYAFFFFQDHLKSRPSVFLPASVLL